MPKKRSKRYRVVVGCNFGPDDTRAEPGDVLEDLPPDVVKQLLALGAIEEADD